MMLIKALILSSNERALNVIRNRGERDKNPALVLLVEFRKAIIFVVEDNAGARQFEALELSGIRKVKHGVVIEVDDIADVYWRIRPGLILAELAIRNDQIGQLDTVQGRYFAGYYRLRIFH